MNLPTLRSVDSFVVKKFSNLITPDRTIKATILGAVVIEEEWGSGDAPGMHPSELEGISVGFLRCIADHHHRSVFLAHDGPRWTLTDLSQAVPHQEERMRAPLQHSTRRPAALSIHAVIRPLPQGAAHRQANPLGDLRVADRVERLPGPGPEPEPEPETRSIARPADRNLSTSGARSRSGLFRTCTDPQRNSTADTTQKAENEGAHVRAHTKRQGVHTHMQMHMGRIR